MPLDVCLGANYIGGSYSVEVCKVQGKFRIRTIIFMWIKLTVRLPKCSF